MISYLIRRIFQTVILLTVLTGMVFVMVWLIGNPVDILISSEATEADRLKAMSALGLDRPLHEQYFAFLADIVRGDWGTSFVYKEPVTDILLRRMPATLELAAVAFVMAVVVSIPAGLYAGLRPEHPLSLLRRAYGLGRSDES